MKKPESTKNVLSRRAFMKSVAAGGGALCLLGLMGKSLSAKDIEVFSEPKRTKKTNEPIGMCSCGYMHGCGGGGSGGQCSCGYMAGCGGSGG
jgi:anaerobic selenocysteine-containing dehydrogenase